ncbi:MAG: effector-associated domain EAD1-containing protein [Deltaproteobacteria bacterium]
MRKLTGPELQELRTIVVEAYSTDELKELVRVTFDEDLFAQLAPEGKPFSAAVFDLLESLERRDKTPFFLEAVGNDRPGNARLTAFRKSIGQTDGAASRGTAAVSSGNVRDAVVRFNARFQERRRQFSYLNAYKELHDALHHLQDLHVGIAQAADRFRQSPDDPTELENIVEELQDLVQSAKTSAGATEFPDDVEGWLASFGGAVDEMCRCLEGRDPAGLPRALEVLGVVPTEQAGLNRELVRCAKRLKADELVTMMDGILASLSQPAPRDDNELGARLEEFRALCKQLAGRIADHDACQEVDTALREAVGLADVSPDRIAGWANVTTLLEGLAARHADDPRAGRLVDSVKQIEAAHAAGDARRTAGEFARLADRFDRFFNEADKGLLKVTDDLVREADLLDANLKRYL